MNIITETRKALIRRLGEISIERGYRTNIGGSVKAGWFNEIAKDADVTARGMVVVQRGQGKEPKRGPHGLIAPTGFTVVGAIRAGLNEYEDAIEDVELDLLQCLVPMEGARLTWLPRGATQVYVGAPVPIPPGEDLLVATVRLPIHISTIIEGISR